MNELLIALTPLIVLLILALFRFTACKSFGEADAPAPPSTGGGPTPVPVTYEQVVAGTKGFAAHWPLDETGGNVAKMLGSLNLACKYVGTPLGTSLTFGQNGARHGKDSSDLAPEFLGTSAYVEVPFSAALNPGSMLAFSVEFWLKPNPDLGPDTQVVISSQRFDNQLGYEILLVKVSGEPHQQVTAHVIAGLPVAPAAQSEVSIQLTNADGTAKDWRYVLMTYEGNASGTGTLTLYVRIATSANWYQESKSSVVYKNVTATSPATLRFGSSHKPNQDAGNFLAGLLDDVAFYNAVLTQADGDARVKMA